MRIAERDVAADRACRPQMNHAAFGNRAFGQMDGIKIVQLRETIVQHVQSHR